MPTGLVGTVLLTLRGRGVGRNELIRKVVNLRNEIIKRGGSVAELGSAEYAEVVDRAVKVLKDLIGHRVDTLEPVYYPMKRFSLSFYRNQVIHYFVHDAIFCVAMYTTIKKGGSIKAQQVLIRPNLVDDVSFISRLLKLEFVYQGEGLEKNLEHTLQNLINSNVVMVGDSPEGKWVTISDEERRVGRETYDFYCFLLWPFIETYWLAAVSLYTLLPDQNENEPFWVDERLFMKRCQIFGKTLYYEGMDAYIGDLSYFEAINKETLGNAMQRLAEMGMIKTFKGAKPPGRVSGSGNSWISLSKDWVPSERLPELAYSDMEALLKRPKRPVEIGWSELTVASAKPDSMKDTDPSFQKWYRLRPKGKLWDFCENIGTRPNKGRFRREGKNRRDTSTVPTRVLRLARHAEQYGEKPKKKQPAKL